MFWLLLFFLAPHVHGLRLRELVRTSACVFAKGGAPKRRTNNPLGSRERGFFFMVHPDRVDINGEIAQPKY